MRRHSTALELRPPSRATKQKMARATVRPARHVGAMAPLLVAVGLWLTPSTVSAQGDAYCAEEKQPYCFDVNLAERPADVQALIDEYSQELPGLPTHRLTETALAGPVAIWLFHEATQLLSRLVSADQNQDYVWPRDLVSCETHAGFVMGEILSGDAPQTCQPVAQQIEAALSELDACGKAAEPERYVLSYPPGEVNDNNTNTLLDLIGVMGSTFVEFPPLYDGMIPADFVGRLRDVLSKLRYDELMPPLNAQIASFEDALHALQDNSECFIPDASAELEAAIQQLISEATAQRDRIEELRQQGEAEHEKEKLRLAAISRARHELVHPSLTQADREFLAFWIGALYWRLRGGGIIQLDGTQDARRLGLRRPFNVIGEMSGAGDGTEAADGVYCEIFSGWGEWFDMGTTPGQEDKYYDLVKMTNRGYEQIRTAESGTTLLNPCMIPDPPFYLDIGGLQQKGYDTTELFGGGLSMGPCYYFPWDQLLGWRWAHDLEPPYGGVVDGPTSIGELCAGGSIALGLVRALMYGWELSEPPYGHTDAITFVEPQGEHNYACADHGHYASLTVIPLDGDGGPLPAGQDVSVVEDPPYIVAGAVESFTDPNTGVTEYSLEVGSNRCSHDTPYEVRIRVGQTELSQTAQIHFRCPPVARDGVFFSADPPEVPADGVTSSEISIEAKDICGNSAFGREVTVQTIGDVSATLSASELATLDALNEPTDGVAVVEASSSQVGSVGVEATIEGEVFQSGTELVTFTTPVEPDGGAGVDGGVGTDGGENVSKTSDGGCSCTVGSTTRRPIFPVLLFLLLMTCFVFRFSARAPESGKKDE